MCAALAAARHGVRTALVQNRPVLGGNGSSEIRMHVCGAGGLYCKRQNARETGIIEELLLENKANNMYHSFSIFDTVIWSKVHFQKNLDLYLNTEMFDVGMDGRRVSYIKAYQATTQKYFQLFGSFFADTTGDGTLAIKAGAEHMRGRESRAEFGEEHAPDQADIYTMGNTLLFKAVDRGHPVPFTAPSWAEHYTEKDLAFREHKNPYSGYWWIELGGDMNVIADYEKIRDKLLATVYGVWDHIKNTPGHGAENLDLDWVQFLPGKRESYRIVGDHILTEQEIVNAVPFSDTVAYGGWPIDLHIPTGIKKGEAHPNQFVDLAQVYGIPYRCLYAKGLDNLLIGGRAISATHIAFSSTRCMGTTSVIGQAIGTAVAVLRENNMKTVELGDRIEEVQQMLLRDDCFLPNVRNQDEADLCRKATFVASSQEEEHPACVLNNGYARPIGDSYNGWVSLEENRTWLDVQLNARQNVTTVIVKFDSDLNQDLMITLEKELIDSRPKTLPRKLMKDFTVEFICEGQVVEKRKIENNHLRSCVISLDNSVECDTLHFEFLETYGDKKKRVFEVRAYS